MRQLVAIFMLAIFAFNVAGYQLYYNFMAATSDAGLELALDQKNYSDDELITIKQPTNLPYYSNSKDFQRIDGEVEMDGIKYKYVQCRIYNDSLEMRCIPNKSRMQIEQSKNEYAKVAHDFQQDNGKKKSGSENKSFQKSLSEYEEQQLPSIDCGSKLLVNNYVLVNSVFEENRYFTTEEHPPDTILS
jgi:hypothetical protein